MKFAQTEAALTYFHQDREKHLEFVEKMNSKDSEFNKIESVEDRIQAVMDKVGLKKLPIDGLELDNFNALTIAFLNFQHHNKYTLLRTRECVYLETIKNLMVPLELVGVDAEDRLKNVKLKGDLNDLAGRLVVEIDTLYKEIYSQSEELGKEAMKNAMSPEKRLKKINGN